MRRRVTEINTALSSTDPQDTHHGIKGLYALLQSLGPLISSSRAFPATTNSVYSIFCDLQSDFEYNTTFRIIQYYRLIARLGVRSVAVRDIILCNSLLQGLLLIHPRSRALFSVPDCMTIFIDLLAGKNNFYDNVSTFGVLEIQTSFVQTLIHVLLKNISNYRMFEACGGCAQVIKLFRLVTPMQSLPLEIRDLATPSPEDVNSQQQNLNFKIIELLIMYMADESVLDDEASHKTVQEKCSLFEPYFPEINSLVDNLNILKSA